MATITVIATVPNDKIAELIDAVCANYEYTNPNMQLPGGETKQQFAQRMADKHFRHWLTTIYKNQKTLAVQNDPLNNVDIT
jgi:hypothetical protein